MSNTGIPGYSHYTIIYTCIYIYFGLNTGIPGYSHYAKELYCEDSYFRGVHIFCTQLVQCPVSGRKSKHKTDITARHGIHHSNTKSMKYSDRMTF